jgi:tetratricopeptide (TPR) repeat protein
MPPLLSTGTVAVQEPVLPIPPIRSFNWLRLWPAFAGIAVVAAGAFGAQRVFNPPRHDVPPPALVPVPDARRAQVPLSPDPWQARLEMEDRVRPRPDRRFLTAFEDLQRLVTGAQGSCVPHWSEETWRIVCDGALAARIPGTPTFADALRGLRARAGQLGAVPHAAPAGPFTGLSDQSALARLREVQGRWNPRDPAAVHDAAEALVALSFHALDTMEVGDALPARALAALALAEELRGGAEPAMEALLASAMGYWKSAASIASALPAADPLRAYILRDDSALEAVAESGTLWARLLWLRRLEALGRTDDAVDWRDEQLRPVARTVVGLRPALFQTHDVEARSIQHALPMVKAAFERDFASDRPQTAWSRLRSVLPTQPKQEPLLESFEGELGEISAPGPVFDRALIAAYFRGAFYSGVSATVTQLIDGHRAPEDARGFLESLGALSQPPAQHLGIWIDAQLPFSTAHEYTRGKPGAEALAASLELGPWALQHALRFVNQDEDASARAARIVMARMDTRPEHRRMLAADALYAVPDVELAKRACAAILLERDDDASGVAICARTLRDRERLLAVARSPALNLGSRAAALTFLSDVGLASPQEIDAEFGKLLPLDDGWARVVSPYVDVLEQRGDHGGARRVIEAWLPTPRGSSIIEQSLRASRARMLQLEGNPQEAWRELEPLTGTGHYGVMMRAAYVLAALGRKDEAVAMARKRLDRLPNDWNSLTVLVELLWRAGKPDEAANTLMHPPFRVDVDAWRERIGPAFARAFADRPDADALGAFVSLKTAGVVRRNLRELAVGAAGEVRNTLALAMLTRLLETGPADPVLLVRTASVMRSLQGLSAATAWLRAQTRPEDVYSLARILYEQRQHELLWTALPEELPATALDGVWLLRAADASRSPQEQALRAPALAQHFAAAQGTETYLLGRYLSGLSNVDSVRRATHRTRTAWVLGVRAEAEGHPSDASAWYQVAAAGEDMRDPERRFAEETLSRWVKESIKTSAPAKPSK